jgi:hypothetical protein
MPRDHARRSDQMRSRSPLAMRREGDGVFGRGIATCDRERDNRAMSRAPSRGTSSARGFVRYQQAQRTNAMNATTTFPTLAFDQLDDVTGGINWGELGRATAGGAVGGAAAGAVGGAITGSFAGGVGALPGAGVGALAGGAGGAITGGFNNFGQQMGWWR